MGFLGSFYERVYGRLCGRHPNLYPWHFQWLAIQPLQRDLKRLLKRLGGDVLDVGCGLQPYRNWFESGANYVAADLEGTPLVDAVLVPGDPLPFERDSFDVVLCSQVFEHVADLPMFISEISRVLRPGGRLVVSMPFIFNEHGAPHDYRRFSVYGVEAALGDDYEIEEITKQGGIGSSLAVLALNWFETQMNAHPTTRMLKAFLMPVNVCFSFVMNCLGLALDAIDTSGSFYGNVLVVAKRTR